MTHAPDLADTPHLAITKTMRTLHGRVRPFIEVRAHLEPRAQAFLVEHFSQEVLFKRSAYANGFADGGLQASPPLSRMLANFVRNDACPEITVKTLTNGQKYEGAVLWDIECFDFIARRSFDALVELAHSALTFETTRAYRGFGMGDELVIAAAPAAVPVAGIERVANAA